MRFLIDNRYREVRRGSFVLAFFKSQSRHKVEYVPEMSDNRPSFSLTRRLVPHCIRGSNPSTADGEAGDIFLIRRLVSRPKLNGHFRADSCFIINLSLLREICWNCNRERALLRLKF